MKDDMSLGDRGYHGQRFGRDTRSSVLRQLFGGGHGAFERMDGVRRGLRGDNRQLRGSEKSGEFEWVINARQVSKKLRKRTIIDQIRWCCIITAHILLIAELCL